ncbi:OLC1v1002178C1 [Oldenlandia corymbosa var. corymbosa]|nr:OLC1v1002178C1 [Oldenlandia corymbosa var. corymbosa]
MAALLNLVPQAFSNPQQLITPNMIKSWCAQTPHQQKCEDSFIRNPEYSSSIIKGKPDFLKKSLFVALKHAKRAAAETYNLGSKCRNSREEAAWRDCVELYDLAIQYMNETIDPHTKISSADAQTYLSTSLTYIDTCKQGFKELEAAATENYMIPSVSHEDVSSLISNSLALNMVPFSEPTYKRDFPSWVFPRDRKLLQAAASPATMRPNIVVAKDGSGNYATVGAAVAAAVKLAVNGARIVIYIKSGTYAETVVMGKKMKNVMFLGDGIGRTIITGSTSVAGSGATTFRSATVGKSINVRLFLFFLPSLKLIG